jgi:holo-[acyl-carrier protein] synthase
VKGVAVIVGFGLDVVEIARIERLLASATGERFLARCFTDRERAFCDRFRDRAQRYAARFAAKEAASKALGVPDGIGFHDVEVVRERGAPSLHLRGPAERRAAELGVARVHLTISHDGGVAVAAVVLEAGEARR